MEGFKANPKMKSEIACFKEGGSVYKSRTHREDPTEAAEDKAMVKKGIRQHEAAKHKGEEKTDIKLKHGGRCKKDGGKVKRFKTGGLSNPMKTGGVANVKKAGGKADAPSAASKKKKESPGTTNKASKKLMTASSTGPVPSPTPAASAALSMPENQPIEMMADGRQPMGARGPVSDEERRAAMMAAQPSSMVPPVGMTGGMGAAAASAPMGNAAPLGVVSDQERQILKALHALGQYAEGGSTY